MLDFHVIGAPAPQGSKKAIVLKKGKHAGRAVVVEDSKHVKPWRAALAAAISEAMGSRLAFDGPLALHLRFVLPAPPSLSRKELARGPCKKPDLDKLVRAVMDAITDAGAWADDGRVVHLDVWKRYAAAGEALGVYGRLYSTNPA